MRLNVSALPLINMGILVSSVVTISSPSVLGLTGAQVNQVAEKVTVFIRGIDNADHFGSGVLIDRKGNLYKVLTAAHVIEVKDQYTVTTADNLQHKILDRKKIPNVDLAVVTFESTESYAIAKIGDAKKLNPTNRVFVAGFPRPGFNIPVPTYTITNGNVTTILRQSMRDGYGIAYTNPTRTGMSGGPVFNEEAKVIGIHGRKEGETDGSHTVGAWLNLGIPINLYQETIVGGGTLVGISPPSQPAITVSQSNKPIELEKMSNTAAELKLALLPLSIRQSSESVLSNADLSNSEIKQYCKIPNSNPDLPPNCRTVVNLQPLNEANNHLQQVGDYLSRGSQAYRAKNYADAIALYSQALALSPQDPIALHNRGVAHYAAQQPEKALQDFQFSLREFEAAKNQKQVLYLNTVIQKLEQQLRQ